MKKISVLIATILPVFCSALIGQNVHAAFTDAVKATELWECYTSDKAFTSEGIEIGTNLDIRDVVSDTGSVRLLEGTDVKSLSCRDLVAGSDNKGTGVISGATKNMNQQTAQDVLGKLGYVSTDSSDTSTSRCVQFAYAYTETINIVFGETQTSNKYSEKICVSALEKNGDDYKFTSNSAVTVQKDVRDLNFVTFEASDKQLQVCRSRDCETVSITNGGSWSSFRRNVHSKLESMASSADFSQPDGGGFGTWVSKYDLLSVQSSNWELETSGNGLSGNGQDSSWHFAENSASAAAGIAITNIKSEWNGKKENLSKSDIKFSPEERSDLHKWYFNNYYKASIICEGDAAYDSFTVTEQQNGTLVPATNIKSKNDCWAKASRNIGGTVRGVSGGTYLMNSSDYTFAELVAAMSEEELLNVTTMSGESEDADPGSTSDEESDPCYDNSGSLGWIMCPVIMKLNDTLSAIYEEMVDPFLKVEASLLDADSGTRQAWATFRDIANTLFVVLLIVVIFSQLTGVGIDNYGIKKILPKLIVSAILINLSYLICQLAVDVSNILGSGLNVMLSGLAEGIGGSVEGGFSSGAWFKTMLNALVGVLTVGGGVSLVHTTLTTGLAGIIMPLLIGLFIAFVAVIFFFALLGLRKAGVIILVAVSPIALVCYMLPNTKRIFDRWLSIFKGLLLVYPICGLTIGGGVLASRMLISESDDFFVYMIGLLITVVPFFLVPFFVRNAFNAVGNIGAKISRFGNRFGRGTATRADAGIRKSDTFRRADNWLGRHNALSTRRRAVAVEGTTALARERAMRARLGDRGNMQTRIAATVASEDAKAMDEATSQRLSLMMSSGEGGGIVMGNGTRAAYTLQNAEARMKELEAVARGRALTTTETTELSALARGMAGMKGGAGKMGKIIRNSSDGNGGANTNFMSAFGEVYARDATVQSKMNEKDAGASVYAEHFMPGGDRLSANGSASTFGGYQGTQDYTDAVGARVKSYEAGLNQGGAAVDEYIRSLTKADAEAIRNDEVLYNSLDIDVRKKLDGTSKLDDGTTFAHAAVVAAGPSPQKVTGTVNINQPTPTPTPSPTGGQTQSPTPTPTPSPTGGQTQSPTPTPIPSPGGGQTRPQNTIAPPAGSQSQRTGAPRPNGPLPDGYTQTDSGIIIPHDALS